MRFVIIGTITLFIFLVSFAALFLLDSKGIKNTPKKTPTPGEVELVISTITGSLSYPSEFIPEEMVICAKNLNTAEEFCNATKIEDEGREQFTYGLGYELKVPAGTYNVYAYLPDNPKHKAYYSEFVTCGLSVNCPSHEPIEVNVKKGETAANIDPGDWYVIEP